MASKGELRVNDITLPIEGRLYTPGYIDFEVTQRTIDRTLVSDFVTIKRTFNVAWDRAYGSLVAPLIELYLAKEDVTFYEVQPDLTTDSYTCRLSIPDSFTRELQSGEYGYTGFAITLEEV